MGVNNVAVKFETFFEEPPREVGPKEKLPKGVEGMKGDAAWAMWMIAVLLNENANAVLKYTWQCAERGKLCIFCTGPFS